MQEELVATMGREFTYEQLSEYMGLPPQRQDEQSNRDERLISNRGLPYFKFWHKPRIVFIYFHIRLRKQIIGFQPEHKVWPDVVCKNGNLACKSRGFSLQRTRIEPKATRVKQPNFHFGFHLQFQWFNKQHFFGKENHSLTTQAYRGQHCNIAPYCAINNFAILFYLPIKVNDWKESWIGQHKVKNCGKLT